MRLLCIADVHAEFGRFPAVGDGRMPDADAVLIAGDFLNSAKDIANARRWVWSLVGEYAHVYYVRGNHDGSITSNSFNWDSNGGALVCRGLEQIAAQVGKWRIVGANLSPCFDLPEQEQEWSQMTADPAKDAEYFSRLPPGADILLSHCPPLNCLDAGGRFILPQAGLGPERHEGSPGLRAYIEQHQPRLVVCGHSHEAAGVAQIGTTTVVNCARRAVLVEIADDGTVRVDERRYEVPA